MPVKTGQAFNLAGSLNRAKARPAEQVGFTDLPGGITDGIAELVEAKRGQYKTGDNQGKSYVRMAATVLEPETAVETKWAWDPAKKAPAVVGAPRTRKVKGLQTSIMLPLCATKKFDAEANSNAMLNMLKLVGGEEFVNGIDFGTTEASAFKALDAALAELQATPGLRVRFSTQDKKPTAEYPEGGVWDHRWHGAVADDGEGGDVGGGEGGGDVDDGTAGADAGDGGGEDAEPPADDDWDAMVEEYDDAGTDQERRDELAGKLLAMAVAAGADETAAGDAADWAAVKEMMDAAAEGGGEAEEAEEPAEEPFEAEKGVVYGLSITVPKNPKDKKSPKVKKKLQVETTAVNKKDRTVTVKDCATKKTLMTPDGKKPLAVSWDDLIVE